ncbi:hypothetical protein [Magnetospirillum sulfuroxidans]|uniref:Uncharacterized protein n=1 Tax=Magnetospirillum sulfuroxidans TaxID=611300 RepID=A0ABS5IEF8_9PROT|nr:hypothetical protein [Magnetospirillum sulfuroxidans]MBR9972724.1 hypothetical protein [Magnetospirillum sulfuroxidans]
MSASSTIQAGIRDRLLHRLRALMARTVVNGASPDEELVAARMTAKVIAQLDGSAPPPAQPPPPNWAQAERDSREYQQLLEKSTTETLLKNAVQELALEQINRVAPPRRRQPGEYLERVGIHDLLDAHLGMALSVGGNRMAHDILARAIDELVYEGQLPAHMDIPAGR